MSKNRDILIWGGYGGVNLGDEAILRALAEMLRRIQPNSKQYVLIRGTASAVACKQYEMWGISPIRAWTINGIKCLLTMRLIAGGGQLVDDKSLFWPIGFTSLFVFTNWIFRGKPIIVGIGAEPLHALYSIAMVRWIYSLAKCCICRDVDSANVLLRAGVPKSKVIIAADIVFSLKMNTLPSRSILQAGRPNISIVVSHDVKRSPADRSSISELVDASLRCGACVRLLPHDLRLDYDLGMLNDLEGQYGGHENILIRRPSTVDEVLADYADSDIVISSRMHPMILSALAGSLPVALPRTLKVKSLVRCMELPTLDNTLPLDAQIHKILSRRNSYLADFPSRIGMLGQSIESTLRRALEI